MQVSKRTSSVTLGNELTTTDWTDWMDWTQWTDRTDRRTGRTDQTDWTGWGIELLTSGGTYLELLDEPSATPIKGIFSLLKTGKLKAS